jgi:hypothetical protein
MEMVRHTEARASRGKRVSTLAALIALAIGLIFMAGATKAASSAGNAPASAQCGPNWVSTSTPNSAGASNVLNGVAAISPTDVWAVGYYDTGSGRRTLALHWNGSSWSIISSPNAGAATSSNTLRGVAAAASYDVWAVGDYFNGSGTLQTLILHWNGSGWSIAASPNNGTGSNSLNGVAAVSATDVWAVGEYDNSGIDRTLALHWNGSAWGTVQSANAGAPNSDNALNSVAASGSSNVWAVGHYYNNVGTLQTLTERWNGTSWALLPSPNAESGDNSLNAITIASANDAWAVGNYTNSSGVAQALTLRWNGTIWTVTPSQNAGNNDNVLRGVSASSPSSVWAVGYSTDNSGTLQTLIERWNGGGWSTVSSPNSGSGGNRLNAVSALGTGDAWAAGYFDGSGGQQTLITAYNPCAAPNNTPVPPAPSNTPRPTATNTVRPSGTATNSGPTATPTRPDATNTSVAGSTAQPTATRVNATVVPTQQASSRYFPETKHTVRGRFLAYWDANGGLMQQGYPITEEFAEVSDLNGKSYTVQYFERAVFELHPENRSPFDVLLSHLGLFYYRDKYPKGAPNQTPNIEPGSVLVPETGKRLGGAFLDYWKTHGGLMQQGYPISDEFTEVSDLNGKPYKVQYFERAVFELHPEISDPRFRVLLSHLGVFRYRCKYQGGPCVRRSTGVQIAGQANTPGNFVPSLWAGLPEERYISSTADSYLLLTRVGSESQRR